MQHGRSCDLSKEAKSRIVTATVVIVGALAAVDRNHDALIIGSKKVSAAGGVTSQ